MINTIIRNLIHENNKNLESVYCRVKEQEIYISSSTYNFSEICDELHNFLGAYYILPCIGKLQCKKEYYTNYKIYDILIDNNEVKLTLGINNNKEG